MAGVIHDKVEIQTFIIEYHLYLDSTTFSQIQILEGISNSSIYDGKVKDVIPRFSLEVRVFGLLLLFFFFEIRLLYASRLSCA